MDLPVAPGPAAGPASRPAPRRRDLRTTPAALAAAALVALIALVHRDVLFRGRVYYYRDIHLQWIVQAEAFVRCFHAGAWPLWNPYVSFGQPLLANPNAEVLYPPTWLNLLMLPWTYYTAFVVFHGLLSGAGMVLLSRRLGLSWPAAAAAAAAWIAGGPFLSLVSLWNHLAGAAWLPWSAWAADRALASGRLRDGVVWGATVAAPVLAGSPETMLMAALASAVIAARHARAHPARRLIGLAAVAGTLAAGLSAAQWMPALELAQRSARSSLSAAQATLWSLSPAALGQCLAPAFLDRLPLRPEVRAALFEGREPLLGSLYLGLAASGLVLAAVLERRRLPRVLLAILAGAVLVSLGRHAPVLGLLQAALPPLRALRFPAKAMILVAFLWAILVGLGLDALGHAAGWRAAAVRAWLLATAVVSAGAAVSLRARAETLGPLLVAEEFRRRSLPVVMAPVWHGLLAAAVAAALVAALATPLGRRLAASRWASLVALVIAVDLLLAHRRLNPTADPELLRFRPPALGALADRPPLSRVYSYDYYDDARAERYLGHRGYLLKLAPDEWPVVWADAAALRGALYPSVLGYWGVETAYGIDALGLYPEDLSLLTTFLRLAEGTPLERRLLQMGAVSRVVALHESGFEDLVPLAVEPGLFLEPVRVFAVPDPLPRAYAVEGVRVADERDALRAIADPTFDPRREVVLAAGSAVLPRDGFSASVRVAEWRPDHVALEVDLGRPGHVVLVDSFDPAWRAAVDGTPAPVLRANLALRAVAVPAGHHRVEMAYRPRSVLLGLVVSALTLGAAFLLLRRSRGAGA